MIKLKGLTDFGCWLKKGKITIANNQIGSFVIQKGYAEFIDFVDKNNKDFDNRMVSKEEMKKRLNILKKYNVPVKKNYSLNFMVNFLYGLKGGH